MDNIVRKPTRAQRPAAPATSTTQPAPDRPSYPAKKPMSKWWTILIIAVIVLLGGLATWWLIDSREPSPMSDRYQAVFLDDGKVFFGHLGDTNGDYLTLDDAYYTQTPASSSDGETQLQPTGGVNLVKVGDEIYGPENSMTIRADKVLFWQNLTTDNQIVKAIKNQEN